MRLNYSCISIYCYGDSMIATKKENYMVGVDVLFDKMNGMFIEFADSKTTDETITVILSALINHLAKICTILKSPKVTEEIIIALKEAIEFNKNNGCPNHDPFCDGNHGSLH